MGAWGTGPFMNDDALDWIEEFRIEGVSAIDAVFTRVSEGAARGFIEAPEAEMTLAAAEIIAAAHGHPLPPQPGVAASETVAEVLNLHRDDVRADAGLVDGALKALGQLVKDPATSELLLLWAEASEADNAAFLASIEDLRTRLEAAR